MEQWLKYIGVFAIAFGLIFAYFYFQPKTDCDKMIKNAIKKYDNQIDSLENINRVLQDSINIKQDSIRVLQESIETRSNSLDSLKQAYEDKISNVPKWNANELTKYFTDRYPN
jgi:DNA repair ATPase RecN